MNYDKESFLMGLYTGLSLGRERYEKPEQYFCFISSNNSQFSIGWSPGEEKTWDGELYYSTDTITWTEWNAEDISSSIDGKIYFRGINNTIISGDTLYGEPNGFSFRTGGSYYCYGNVEILLDYEAVSRGEHPPMGERCFQGTFCDCPILTAPQLPSLVLSRYCYEEMFYYCDLLMEAPELPATTLTEYCYSYMFAACPSLIKPPSLPATSLAEFCYNSMFASCTNLIETPKLPATSLAESCYNRMFSNCSSLTRLPKLPATTLVNYCYASMFEYCSNIKVSTASDTTYQYAFQIPYANTGTMVTNNALNSMFARTGGSFKGTPRINTPYYTDHDLV